MWKLRELPPLERKKLVKNTILVLLILNLHSTFLWWFLTLCISETVIRHRWRHYDVIRRHDVNNWDRDMKFCVVELEVIANKRPPRFLWLSSPIMKYEVLILPTGKNLDFSWFLHIKTCFWCNKSVTFHVIKNWNVVICSDDL